MSSVPPPVARLSLAVLGAFLLFVVLFWRLGVPSFWDPDEAHYAQTTQEMVATGDWMAPFYNERPFFDKPVFFHQLQGVAMVIFGTTEFAARLVSALGALALVVVTLWFGARVDTGRVGLIAGLLLAVNPGVFGLARYAILDTVFTAFLFGGAALLTIAALRDRPSLQWPGYVAIACAVLTKGPLALVLCGLTLIAASMASADLRRRLFGLRWIAGLALILAIAAPWFIYMYVRFRHDFVDGYVLDENLRLFAASRFENQPGPLFYVQILAAGFLPWTGVLIGRLLDDAGAVIRGERLDPVETLLWLWLLVVVAFFSASTFKLDHYVFPAAPAMCLLCARALEDVRTGSARRSTWSRVGAFTVGPTLVAIGIAMAVLLLTRLALPRAALVIPAALISCGLAFTIGVWRRSSARLSALVPWSALVALGVTYAGLIAFALPALEEHKVAPDLARFVASHATTEDRVATYRLNRLTPAFRFYVNRHTDFLETPPQAEAMFASGRQFYCVMAREAYDELTARGARLAILYQRQGMWVTSGRLLFRNRPAPTTFVVVGQAR